MSGRSPAGGLLVSGVAVTTTWVAMHSWGGFTSASGRFLWPLALLGVVVVAVGSLTRRWRWPGAVVLTAQVLVSGMVASTLLCGVPLPIGSARDRLVDVFTAAGASASAYAAPVPADVPPVEPIFVVAGLACLLLVDLLAATLGRVPLAGLPLLTVFSVPVSLLGGTLSWRVFAGTAAGFLLMLFLHEGEKLARWGRPLGEAETGTGRPGTSATVRSTATRVGGIATALAVVLPVFIPTLELRFLDLGQGPGGSSGIRVTNPMTDLKRDLVRGRDIPLLEVRTDDPDPAYLRITALTRFSDNEWSAGDRDVPASNRPTGKMPALVGVDPSVPRRSYRYDVQVSNDFSSSWLPTQAPISRIRAEGDWRYDPSTMDFIAGSDGLDAAGEAYTMTGVRLAVSAADLSRARPPSGAVVASDTTLPPGIPSVVRAYAEDVTRKAPTRFEKAVALQDWFRSTGGFVYDTSVAPGNGTDDLVAFLTKADGRRGYCEQFASAMAVMARMLDIPARVAVGFLRPRSLGDGRWEYSAHDLHSWPELYFPGAGWVRFEPTPAQRATSVPGYTTQQVPGDDPTAGGPAALPRDNATPGRTAGPSPRLDQQDTSASPRRRTASSTSWAPLVVVLGGAVVVAVLLLLPRALRRRQRARRLAGGPEDAWEELRATAIDLGVPWPEGRSPRATARVLVEHLGAPLDTDTPSRPTRGPDVAPDAAHALDRLVGELELLRYARDGGRAGGHRAHVHAETDTCLEALVGGATSSARRRAAWWPRSVFSGAGSGRLEEDRPPVSAPQGRVVDHVG